MISNSKIHKLYDIIIFGKDLTTQEIINCGFNKNDIKKLIENKVIDRIKIGYYKLIDVEGLFLYGKRLILEKDYTKADVCFKKCYKMDPSHSGVCFQLFNKSIKDKDYKSAFNHFKVLFSNDNPHYKKDANLYLYLLNLITDIPSEYKNHVKNLQISDIIVEASDKRFQDTLAQNRIRGAIFSNKISLAIKELNILMKEQKVNSQNFLTRILLYQAIDIKNARKEKIINLIKEENYSEIILILNNLKTKQELGLLEETVLKLVNDISVLKNTDSLPKREFILTDNMFEAIEGYNYELALKLCEEFNKSKNVNNETNLIHILLSKIINILNDKKKPNVEEAEEEIKIEDIINNLTENKIDESFTIIKKYLKKKSKTKYEFLIINLIKISILEKDSSYIKPMLVLTSINNIEFSIDINSLLKEFYANLYKNNLKIAEIYIDIIDKYSSDINITKNLKLILNNVSNNIRNVTDTNKTNEEMETKSRKLPKVTVPIEKVKNNILTLKEPKDSRKEFIAKKYSELLVTKGALILKPMNEERRKKVHNIVKEYDDMVSFSIGEGDNRRVVLKYQNPNSNIINIKNMVRQSAVYYKERKYDECIKINKEILANVKRPRTQIYANLGTSYLKKNDIYTAIEYLTIATELSKNENGYYKFDELISRLKGEEYDDDIKVDFKMEENEFYVDEYYGTTNFDEIIEYVLNSGLDVENACKEYGLNIEETDIVKLICAKKYYENGYDKKGEEFLKSVERNNNKTSRILNILNEIKRNKKIYYNKAQEPKNVLTLALKLGKVHNN